MKAFHGDQKIKEFYINRIKEHAAADEIVKGKYWEFGKGCAVGCTIHGDKHLKYESELGIPIRLSYLEDKIFENIPNKLAMSWPLRFLESIEIGADLSKVWPKFAIFLLTDPTQCNSRDPQCKIVADFYKNELNVEEIDWINIKNVAYADAMHDTYAAAAHAAHTAAYAAYTANYAAYASPYPLDCAYIKQSEKLIELLKECK